MVVHSRTCGPIKYTLFLTYYFYYDILCEGLARFNFSPIGR